MVKRMVTAGIRLQQKAHELTVDVEKEAVKAQQEAGRVKKFGMKWLRVTREAGPRRTSELRAVTAGAGAAVEAIVEEAKAGVIDLDNAAKAISKLQTEGSKRQIVVGSEVEGMLSSIRSRYRRVGAGGSYWQWRLVALARRWRLMTALLKERRKGWEGVEDPVDRECEVYEFNEDGDDDGPSLLEPEDGAQEKGPRVSIGEPSLCVPGAAMYEAATGRRMRRGVEGPWRFEWGQCTTETMQEDEARAAKIWNAGGGWKGEKKRREATRAMKLAREVAERARRFKAFMGQEGTPITGLSGAKLGAIGEHLDLVINIRGGKKSRRTEGGRTRAGSLRKRMFNMGAGPDRWKRWKVKRLAEVRYKRGGTRNRRQRILEVRVQWRGINPNTGLPWKDTWTEALAKDAEGGYILNPSARRAAKEKANRRYGMRAPARATGVHKKVREARVPTVETKVRGVFRTERREAGETADEFRNKRKVGRISSDEEEETPRSKRSRKVKEALEDIRRQRGVVSSLWGQGVRRKRRAAVLVGDDGADGGNGIDRRGWL